MRDKGKIAECLTDLKEILKWQKDILGYGAYIDIIDDTVSILKDCPEIIRCKDCKHRGKAEKCVLAAISAEKDYPVFMLDNRGEWFCADGKRK